MDSIEFIVSVLSAFAATIAALAAWMAANEAKKNTELTQKFNEKNDQQKRNEVKPLLEIVAYGTKKEEYEIAFKNLGFQTVLFLDARITNDNMKKLDFMEDILECEISISNEGLFVITLNKQANTGTLQVESELLVRYKTIYNDVITDSYHLVRGVDGKPKRISIDFGKLQV